MTNAEISERDAPIVHWDAGRGLWVYRASALGGCETAMLAARTGMTAAAYPESFQKKFAEGHDNEDLIFQKFTAKTGTSMVPLESDRAGVKDLLSFGPVSEGQIRAEIRFGGCAIRAHGDGIEFSKSLDSGDQYRVAEAKAFAKTYWKEWERHGAKLLLREKGLWRKYGVQFSVLMHGLGLPGVFVVGRKNDNGIVEEVAWEYVDAPPVGLNDLKMIVARVEARASRGEAPSCARDDYPCPFYFLHEQKPKDELTVVEDAQLEAYAAKYHALKEQERAVKAEVETMKSLLVGRMATAGLQMKGGAKARVGGWKVEWVEKPMQASTRNAYVQKFPQVKPA